jgi:hypothetical protein
VTDRSGATRAVRAAPPAPRHAVHAGAAGGAIWAAALATQYVAARLAYHPHLGPWIYRASSADRSRLTAAIAACVVAAGIALTTHRWRWSAVPFSLAAITAMIARSAPLYSPERVFVWYTAYHHVAAYRQLFAVAWIIFGVATVAAALAAARLPAHESHPPPLERGPSNRPFGQDIVS